MERDFEIKRLIIGLAEITFSNNNLQNNFL